MARLIILTYDKSYDFYKDRFIVGGLETYIQDLARLGLSLGYEVRVMLPAKEETTRTCRDITVCGVRLQMRPARTNQALYDRALKLLTGEDDRMIVATEQMAIKARDRRVIAIQHGIGFDMPMAYQGKIERINPFTARMFKVMRCLRHIRKFNNYPNVVCVDYNYVNWYRTLDTIGKDSGLWVIPNYTSSLIAHDRIEAKLAGRNKVSIIFARRFVDYRGARMFIEITARLLRQFDHVSVTFAGNGPLHNEIETRFAREPRVRITSFRPEESVEFHSQYDIAVVPTIFSEGTSLSLCEAMAAGCLPVVTFVGGMSNMILDGYNGLMCDPSSEAFYEKLVSAVTMPPEAFDRMVRNARQSVEDTFSFAKWQERWSQVLKTDPREK